MHLIRLPFCVLATVKVSRSKVQSIFSYNPIRGLTKSEAVRAKIRTT